MKSINYATKLFAFTLLSAIILITAISPVFAEKDKNKQSKSPQPKLWRQINEDNLQSRGAQRAVTPEKYRVFQLDQTILKNSLTELPFENTDAARENPLIIEMPMPDGSLQRFRMEQTAVLSPELAAQYPDWKTFVGYGVDDTAAVGRFDWNAFGFHGYIETDKGIVFIDPYQKGDTKNYLVFYKHEFGKPLDDFSERVDETMSKIVKSDYQSFTPQFSFGASLRTYRLAIATTGEWSRNAAGYTAGQPVQTTRDNALAVVVTSVNRLIGIYTRELSSSFQLVNPPTNNDANNIIFDDPATDPYDNSDNTAQLTINQTTIDNSVGTENYDIGHLFGTGGGGVASSPSICSTQKAEGYSARDTNTGDPFVVDYVAHEMGHQFGADHTYNNLDPNGACTTRSMTDAFEVGSGSTIMSYVGICNQRNLQQFNDFALPTFHIRSLTTINTNITTGDPQTNNCGTASGTNNIPTVSVNGVNAGNTLTIPALTPFTLTATGNDADAGDVANLLYSWEEYDLAPSASGASGTPAETYDVDTDGVLRPLFRAYSPVAGNSRTFPSMAFILNPANNDPAGSNQPPLTYMGTHPTNAPGAVCETGMTCVVGERLPTVARTMNFRVSLRDRRGGVADAGTTVTVADGTGPFQVTVQNSFNNLSPAVTWQGGTMQTVTWDVANTNAAPINAANVNILLSTDGGQTFPITILANTLNDGTEQITVPNNPTTTARIKVEAVGNIFFDINNADFTISAPTAASVSVSGRVSSARGRGIAGAVVRFTNQDGNTRFARTNPFGYYNFADLAAGQTYIFSVSAKGFRFEPRVVSLTENLAGFDFIAR